MIAFASNSLLNRLALGQKTIDAASYTTIRLTAGAIILFLITNLQKKSNGPILRGSWLSAMLLFLYAITFSFAYLSLTTGTGALILFGSVQVTMIVVALRSGERPQALEWLMVTAGIAWGFYSIRGRGSQNPLADTAGNFIYAVPMILLIRLLTLGNVHVSANGILLATLSGALSSGVGYMIWYMALCGLTTTRAAIVQLSVPMIAAWSGILLLSESISARLLIAGVLILGGIGLSVLSREKH